MCAISTMLDFEAPYKKVYMHGTVLGQDGEKMSKHSQNAIRPSDIRESRNCIRYILLRTFSEQDKLVQLEKGKNEFKKIENKINLMLGEGFITIDSSKVEIEKEIEKIFTNLENFKLENAIETFYVLLKNVKIEKTIKRSLNENAKNLRHLCRILFVT